MPNRMIKDSIHDSEKVNAMSDFQFRLWINLITYVDDYGRGDARPAIIKGKCFPLRERLTNKDIDVALAGLAGIGCIVLYEVDGRPYLCFPNWEKHQSIRNKRSKFPAPDGQLQSIAINCNQLQSNVPVIQVEVESKPNSNPKCVTHTRTRETIPPRREDAEAYYAEKGFTFGLDKWFAKYESNGWRVGRDRMKDWQASMRYWQTLEAPQPKKYAAKGETDPDALAEKETQMKRMLQHLQKGGEA